MANTAARFTAIEYDAPLKCQAFAGRVFVTAAASSVGFLTSCVRERKRYLVYAAKQF